jgi:hypothetical protein
VRRSRRYKAVLVCSLLEEIARKTRGRSASTTVVHEMIVQP